VVDRAARRLHQSGQAGAAGHRRCDLRLPARLVNLLAEDHSRAKSGVHRLALEAYAYRWFRVGGLAYVLERER
jgi:hypothetical protein